MNYLITGGTGFIGSAWIKRLDPDRDRVILLSRRQVFMPDYVRVINALAELDDDEAIDVVINLAGSTIAQRWTPSVKQALIDSRVQTTESLIALLSRLDKKPRVVLSASAIGFYGDRDQEHLDEDSQSQDSFTHQLCDAWEKSARQAEAFGVRVCVLRLGVVLGEGGGFIKKVSFPFKCRLGGKLGPGQQFFSWVHRDDVLKAFTFLIDSDTSSGVYNVTAPNVVTNAEFTQHLAQAVHRPAFCHMPACVVRFLYGEMGEALLLKGSYVAPKRLQAEGFEFEYGDPSKALQSLFN